MSWSFIFPFLQNQSSNLRNSRQYLTRYQKASLVPDGTLHQQYGYAVSPKPGVTRLLFVDAEMSPDLQCMSREMEGQDLARYRQFVWKDVECD
ncbi:hypothetical protein WG66_016644 [Moniliophthora roreri]|nr:hypothetical protein WG66_016644 [Moniliophthora roreri]